MSEKKSAGDIYFTRHSKAAYQTYDRIVRSDDPEQAFTPEDQISPDVTPEGMKLAHEKAEELLNGFDPATDSLFFVSSNESRALETAAIYREVALRKGFEILKPKNVRSKVATQIGGGDVRVVKELSTDIPNTLLSTIFNPVRGSSAINWAAVDPQVKQRFEMAQAIIAAGDKGSWGANFFEHSNAITKILPELKSAEKVYETQFKNLVRLVEFAFKKMEESASEKQIKIMAFGHENYLVYMLNKYFGEHGIKNCESLQIIVENDSVMVKKGAITKKIK